MGDPTVTDIACAGLNGMRMGERILTVRRATEVTCRYGTCMHMLHHTVMVASWIHLHVCDPNCPFSSIHEVKAETGKDVSGKKAW